MMKKQKCFLRFKMKMDKLKYFKLFAQYNMNLSLKYHLKDQKVLIFS